MKTENGTKTTYTYNALNQLVKENDTVYKYDDAGNLISTTSSGKSAAYTYNAENKLIRATVQEGNNVSVEEYEYDYAGNRTVKKSENDYTYYLNDVSGSLTQVLAELDSNGNEKCYYTRGIEIISQERSGNISYYLTDGHGSVRQLADSTGAVTDTYVYDAWGNLISSTGTTENSYLYCGEQLDSTTGLYYLRARYMNPTTGMFISMDTYQGTIFDPTSLHKYLYANANPVMNVDPSGNMAQVAMMKAESQHNAWVMAVYHKLMATLTSSTGIYITKNVFNVAIISSVIYLGGKLQNVFLESQINNVLAEVLVGKSESIVNSIFMVRSWIVSLIITVASELGNYWNDHNGDHLHHIVPRKLWYAAPAREILRRVNIYVEDDINKIMICAKTHRAIHSGTVQLLYCSWIDAVLY